MPETATDPQQYRPASYWNPGLTMIANIKGDIRQANAIDRYLEGRLERLPSWFFAESLSDEQLKDAVSQSRAWAGGESLPDYLEGEVEIARVTLHPGHRDVIAIRARPSGDGIAYRVVSEWKKVKESDLGASDTPLSQRELLARIADIRVDDAPLIGHWWSYSAEAVGVVAAVASLKLSSVFYPGLVGAYHEMAMLFAIGMIRVNLSGDCTMPMFGGPCTPARPLSSLQLAVICGDPARVRELLEQGEDPDEPVDPMIPQVMAHVPAFGFNKPLVSRIYKHIGFDPKAVEAGMTARNLALAGGRDDVASLVDRFCETRPPTIT